MSGMSDYRTLDAWQRAHQLTLAVYRATASYPASERYGLTAQTRRAVTSIPSNIAEGAGRDSDRDFARFVAVAAASSNETEYQLLLARDLGYVTDGTFRAITLEIGRVRSMLTRLRQSLAANTK
jgi:four helix bundle protein